MLKALLALGVVGGILLPVALDAAQLREESRLFALGRYEDAARAASHVHLFGRVLQPRLKAQLDGLPDGGVGPALPLLEVAAKGDAALARRLADARRPIVPAALGVLDLRIDYKAPPESPPPAVDRFRAAPTQDEPSEWGRPFQLQRQDPGGHWVDLGAGFAGPLGASFETTLDGRVLWIARDDAKQLERWDLAAGTQTSVAVAGTPAFVAIAPNDPDRVAYSLSSDEGDTLWISDHGKSHQVYPAPGAKPTPWLGFQWASDGASLLVDWQEDDPSGKPNTQLVWVRPDGQVGLEAALDQPADELQPVWVPAPTGGCMGLSVDDGAWAWVPGEPRARTLTGVTGIWGFDPTGSAVAGVDGGQLYVQALDHPEQRFTQTLPQLPPVFEGDPSSFHWLRDDQGERLTFAGDIPAPGGQSARPASITVRLASR